MIAFDTGTVGTEEGRQNNERVNKEGVGLSPQNKAYNVIKLFKF